MTHTLKCWPEFFKATVEGDKFWEFRRFDRPFKIGDTVILQEFNPDSMLYTGREVSMKISYIFTGYPELGIKDGYCILSLKDNAENY